MRKSLGVRARYYFDNVMDRGTPAMIAALALVSLLMIVIFGVIVFMLGLSPVDNNNQAPDFISVAWRALVATLDTGNLSGASGEWPYMVSMLGITLGGVFVVSTLIGIVNSGMQNKLEDMRKGRSFVLEQDHTLILGWSNQIYSIISQLLIANGNRKRPVIVILASKDKVEMEDAIHEKVGQTGNTRVICRTGNPIDLSDLEIANPNQARSIIVLSPDSQHADAQVIKTILALRHNFKNDSHRYHIVAEVRDAHNMGAARLVAAGEAQLIQTSDIISRVIVQTSRQSGLSLIYAELLQYEGDEIYFQEEPALVGQTFGECLAAFEDSSVIGLWASAGNVKLNPGMNERVAAGDKLIVIGEDDSKIKLAQSKARIDATAIARDPKIAPAPERILVLGWNRHATSIIRELDFYVARGSQITIVADNPHGEQHIAEQCNGVCNAQLAYKEADTSDRRVLDSLGVSSYQHVIVLCYSDQLDPQNADARTLITLLHLREIAEQTNGSFSIVSEMLDDRNRALAEVTKTDDFIVSERLISHMMAQVSENKYLNAVFDDLFAHEGSDIYLKPAANYVLTGRPITYATVVEAARQRGEIAIGYKLLAEDKDSKQDYGVIVNPDKSSTVTLRPGDRVIVLAED